MQPQLELRFHADRDRAFINRSSGLVPYEENNSKIPLGRVYVLKVQNSFVVVLHFDCPHNSREITCQYPRSIRSRVYREKSVSDYLLCCVTASENCSL